MQPAVERAVELSGNLGEGQPNSARFRRRLDVGFGSEPRRIQEQIASGGRKILVTRPPSSFFRLSRIKFVRSG